MILRLDRFTGFDAGSAGAASSAMVTRAADCLFERGNRRTGAGRGSSAGLGLENLSLILLRGGPPDESCPAGMVTLLSLAEGESWPEAAFRKRMPGVGIRNAPTIWPDDRLGRGDKGDVQDSDGG